MGFDGRLTTWGTAICLMASPLLAAMLPTNVQCRSLLLTLLHYAYAIPSLVILVTSASAVVHAFSFVFTYALLYGVSFLRLPVPKLFSLSPNQLLVSLISMTIIAIGLQASFGGLTHFNLNLERVYDFRRISSAELPSIFGYIYSNISVSVVPMGLVVAFLLRKNMLAVLMVICCIALFGFTHHKSVFFTPLIVLAFYLLFRKTKSSVQIGWLFILIPILSLFEIYIIKFLLMIEIPGFFTSYTVRRSLLIPPLLDNMYIEFFTDNAKYYWSTSKFSLGLVDSPSSVSAPFLIGSTFFNDQDMSANAGYLGSGFANAGIFGSALYAIVLGLLISLLNGYGRILGHVLVASVSVVLLVTVVTSTDLTTAILSHGLLGLLLVLSITPKSLDRTQRGN
jgi:hypothetical protein